MRPVKGGRARVLEASRAGCKVLFLPRGNWLETKDDLPLGTLDRMKVVPLTDVSMLCREAFDSHD